MSKEKKKSNETISLVAVAVVIVIFIAVGIFISRSASDVNQSFKDTEQKQAQQKQDKTSTSADNSYRKLDVLLVTDLRQEHHYLSTVQPQEDKNTITNELVELKKTCPEDKICDFMIWDSEEAYKARINTNRSNSDLYAKDNSAGLIGYLNSGGLSYYLGTPLN